MAHKAYGLNELREKYLRFFETKGHLRLPSFSLVPQNDKSILLINAGMTPMKPFFTGEQTPPRTRICTCQKCIRTGDIDNVGKTARHGTYFEMLGNFSFGDYFKKEALPWAWEFLTSPEWVGLEPDRLYPSVYLDDDEAFEIWNKDIGIPADRIFRFGKEDNFWEHGAGPCGPCSEIYYDRGPEWGCGKPDCTVGCDCDRYIEVWNIVFSQFNNDGQGNYTELVQKNIDTGMGLERLACVCQNVASLFDTDTVMNITKKVSELTGAHYGQSNERDVSLRVITDHIRSATFMICDGILPSNEGRGYVLRRLLRRAARHGKLLGVNEPFLYRVVETVIHENECQYPELREKQAYITRVVQTEEQSFAKTIDGGMKIFADMLAAHTAEGSGVFAGSDAFKLYDTYGFPIDLTKEMVVEHNMTVDEDAFAALMQEQKVRAREARKALGDLGWAGVEFGKEIGETAFTGYDRFCDEADIVALVAEDELRGTIGAGCDAIVVLDKTPFYAEMGGQSADHGVIETETAKFIVADVQKNKGGKFMHYGKLAQGELTVGEHVRTSIDVERRKAIMRAHSATHLLDMALREVLGEHAHQAGSLVEPDRLRYDFTHFAALTPEELQKINHIVTASIFDDLGVDIREMPIEEARKQGAIALFGEKYGDVVRVVNMGGRSIELCGGTHVDNTAKIGPFRIQSESSVAAGVRRIEAVVGKEFEEQAERMNEKLFELSALLKTSPADLMDRMSGMMQQMKQMQQRMEQMKDKLFSGEVDRFLFAAKDVCGLKVVTVSRKDQDANDLRRMGDFLRDRDPSIVAVLSSVNGEKVTLLAVCGKDAIARGVKAGDLIRSIAPIVGGKGGGKPDSAMGGGTLVLKVDDALAAVDDLVYDKLSV